jgi:hypothetical protein
MRRRLLTVATTLILAGSVVLATAAPAAAHSVSGVTSTNYRTRLLAVRPVMPGVTIKVIEAGSRLELTNRTSSEVVVLGYQGEPYLRVGPDGVFENQKSPATYLNVSRKGAPEPPPDADPAAAPEWRKTSAGQVARWHDHRAHFMGDRNPPAVRRDPGREHVVIPNWEVFLRHGDTEIVARGDLTWVPGPSPVPWVLLALGLAAAAVLVSLTRWWAWGVAFFVVVLVAVDVGHSIGIALETAGSVGSQIARVFLVGFYSVLAWTAGIVAVVALARRRAEGLFAAAFTALVVLLFGGLADISNLSRSQLPFAWDADLARAAVAASLGLGAGITLASILGIRRHLPLTIAAPVSDAAE